MVNVSFRRLIRTLIFAAACVACATAQTPAPVSPYADRLEPTNGWQRNPRDPRPMPADPKGRIDRKARDAWADKFYGALRPLDEDSIQGPRHDIFRGVSPEIYVCDNCTVVVATFSSYDVVLSESRRSVYTEQYLTVESVLETSRPDLRAGSVITAIQPGGTLRSAGQTIAYEVQPRIGVLQPHHRYLLFLGPLSAGDIFLVNKAWELVGGKALPVFHHDVQRAIKGTSRYAGMEEVEFLEKVARKIQEDKQAGEDVR